MAAIGRGTGVLVIGGEAPARGAVDPFVRGERYIVAADSGVETALSLGLHPDLVVGDMDSLEDPAVLERFPPDHVLRFPTDKDETDTEIGLRILMSQGRRRVVVVGGGGGRMDHFLGVAMLFERSMPPDVWLTATACLELLQGSRTVEVRRGETLSFFPTGERARVLRSRGLRWPLDSLELVRGTASLSNEATSDKIAVEIALGGLILVRGVRGDQVGA